MVHLVGKAKQHRSWLGIAPGGRECSGALRVVYVREHEGGRKVLRRVGLLCDGCGAWVPDDVPAVRSGVSTDTDEAALADDVVDGAPMSIVVDDRATGTTEDDHGLRLVVWDPDADELPPEEWGEVSCLVCSWAELIYDSDNLDDGDVMIVSLLPEACRVCGGPLKVTSA